MLKKSMTKIQLVAFMSLVMALISIPMDEANARAGRGKSFGFGRMQRSYNPSFNSRPFSRPYNFNRSQHHNNNDREHNTFNQRTEQRRSFFGQNGSSIFSGIAAGMAGGFLGNMLYNTFAGRSATTAIAGPDGSIAGVGSGVGTGAGAGGGIGIFEILLLLGLGYIIYRLVKSRAHTHAPNLARVHSSYDQPIGQPIQSISNNHDYSYQRENEEIGQEKWEDIFMNIQSAWSIGDLSPISSYVTPEVLQFLQTDLDQMKREGHRNVIDRIALRQTEAVEDWYEDNREYVVVKFQAQLVDYTVDIKTGEVVEGSKTQTIRFEELWTFYKEGKNWKLAGMAS